MVKLAFILLAHEPFAQIEPLLDCLLGWDCTVALHYDARAKPAEFDKLKKKYGGGSRVLFASRVKCGWGDFSLVQGTMNAIASLRAANVDYDYAYLVSGSDLPVRSVGELLDFLDRTQERKLEFIESVPLNTRKWVKGGLNRERFDFRHYFNERKYPLLFRANWTFQRDIGLERKTPDGIEIALGSQWWCLSKATIEAIMKLVAGRPDLVQFFKTVWIPDESFFQSIIRAIIPANRLSNYTLTYYMFGDYGKPLVYFDEHAELLRQSGKYFARKISPTATQLRTQLLAVGNQKELPEGSDRQFFDISDRLTEMRFRGRFPGLRSRAFGGTQGRQNNDVLFTDKFLVVVLISETAAAPVAELQGKLNHQRTLIHGRLFGTTHMQFAADADCFGGYHRDDAATIGNNPLNFLANLLHAGPGITVFFATKSAITHFASSLATLGNVVYVDKFSSANALDGAEYALTETDLPAGNLLTPTEEDPHSDASGHFLEGFANRRNSMLDAGYDTQIDDMDAPDALREDLRQLAKAIFDLEF